MLEIWDEPHEGGDSDCLPSLTRKWKWLFPSEAFCESAPASVSLSQGLLQGLVSPLSILVTFYSLHFLHAAFPPTLLTVFLALAMGLLIVSDQRSQITSCP